jgi:hypothetical protein
VKTKRCSICKRYKITKKFSLNGAGFHSECNKCRAESNRRRIKANPKKYQRMRRDSVLKSRYEMPLEEYERRFKKQKGRCACCGKKETKINYRTGRVQNLSVDHNHKTGKNRGLLCARCNFYVIPIIENSLPSIRKVKAYLRRFRG